MENGILVEKKYVDLADEPMLIKKQKWLPNNVAEYFFFDDFGFLSINEKKIMECYQEFTESMRIIYDNMKNFYNKFTKKIISEDDLSCLEFPLHAKELELRGLEFFLKLESNMPIDKKFAKLVLSPEKVI